MNEERKATLTLYPYISLTHAWLCEYYNIEHPKDWYVYFSEKGYVCAEYKRKSWSQPKKREYENYTSRLR